MDPLHPALQQSWLTAPLVAAMITVSVTTLLWIAKEWRFDRDARSKSSHEKEKYVRALYAEIDFNTHDMEVFIDLSASTGAVKEKIKADKDFIPHITDARHKEIYKSQISLVHHAGDDYIGDVVTFYGIMERIGTEIQGVYLPSYKTISPDGRASVIDDIQDAAFECAEVGQSVLAEMERTYPDYRLRRKTRKTPGVQSDVDLQNRMKALTSDLNRAWSTHVRNS